MTDSVFWDIIAKLNWQASGDDEAVLEPAVKVLTRMTTRDISLFAQSLAEKLFALDTREHARHIGQHAYSPERYFSVDFFLYVRCCVVANGQDTYGTILNNPSAMLKDLEFEALLQLAQDALDRKTGIPDTVFEPEATLCYETYSNRKGWADKPDATPNQNALSILPETEKSQQPEDRQLRTLFTTLEYSQRLQRQNSAPLSLKPAAVPRVLAYASHIWAELGLKKRKLKANDLVAYFSDGELFQFHIVAYARKQRDTVVVIIANSLATTIRGHILIDLAAEGSTPQLDCPSCSFEGELNAEDIEPLLFQLQPDDDNPFAVMTRGPGSFLQTLCTDEGYLLEYQLVNVANHYETTTPLSFFQVVAAFESYYAGDNVWLKSLEWQKMELE